jgi:hypothetical protein
MKHVFTFFLVFILNQSYSQDYIPLLGIDKLWQIGLINGEGCPNPNSTICYTTDLQFQDEVEINGVNYYHGVFFWDDVYLREDTVLKKVFINYQEEEKLLYDFSISVGDTITVFDLSFGPFVELILLEIDFVETEDGLLRRRYHFDGPWSIIWVEGIGNTTLGIMNQTEGFGTWTTLLCFSQAGIELAGESCTVGISEFQVQDSRLEIFPNPASTRLNVRIPQGTVVDHVILVDAMGRIIQGSYSENLESVSLNIESLPLGLYTLILTSEDGELFSSKFVKE